MEDIFIVLVNKTKMLNQKYTKEYFASYLQTIKQHQVMDPTMTPRDNEAGD